LSIEVITENRLLLLFFDDGVGSCSECQRGTDQRLEEHCCRDICGAVCWLAVEAVELLIANENEVFNEMDGSLGSLLACSPRSSSSVDLQLDVDQASRPSC
jgi:hypothetical protein